jgi:hypothetical protein
MGRHRPLADHGGCVRNSTAPFGALPVLLFFRGLAPPANLRLAFQAKYPGGRLKIASRQLQPACPVARDGLSIAHECHASVLG